MAEQFGVTPDELRGTSREVADASSRVKGVMASLRAHIGSEGADALVPGDTKSFWHQYDSVRDAVDPAATNFLDHLADHLRRAADHFERSDQA
jgi:uncharacterized protein YukE